MADGMDALVLLNHCASKPIAAAKNDHGTHILQPCEVVINSPFIDSQVQR